jgi:hypothetical protein
MYFDIDRKLVFSTVLAAAVFACGGQSDAPGENPAPPLSDTQVAEELPTGHPPVGDSPAANMGIVQPPAGAGSGETGLAWQTPAGWLSEQPNSAMRKAQYRVPGDGGDAECVVFYFGPGQGGDPMSNAIRWADQFIQPDGSQSRDVLITEEIEVNGIPVLLSEVTGTYGGGMSMAGGPMQTLEDHMLLGAVIQGPDANWFFKFTGPEATVDANRGAFRGMIDSLAQGS